MAKGQMITGTITNIGKNGCFVMVDSETENYVAFFHGYGMIDQRVLLTVKKEFETGVLLCDYEGSLDCDFLCA